jgi:hypothetical protein
MVKPALRTKSIGFKVSKEEYAQLGAAAQTSGGPLGEWCHEVLLARVNSQEPKAATDSAGTGQVALMAELAALRTILLNVLFKLGKGVHVVLRTHVEALTVVPTQAGVVKCPDFVKQGRDIARPLA